MGAVELVYTVIRQGILDGTYEQGARLGEVELATSLELIRRGSIKVPIAATFPVSDAAAAHRFLERRQHVGKVLLVAE